MTFKNNIQIYNEVVRLDECLFEECLLKSVEFSRKLLSKTQSISYYKDQRRATAPEANIITGKMGEVFAANFLSEALLYPRILPDFTIFGPKDKSWKEDLCYSGISHDLTDFHVKTCDYNTSKFLGLKDMSWTFQKSNVGGIGGMDSVYKEDKLNTVIFVYITSYTINEALVTFIGPWVEVKKLLKPPKKSSLVGIKECIYFSDVLYKFQGE